MRLRRFLQMPNRQRVLLLEAALFLGLARLALLALPFGRIAPWLQRSPDSGAGDTATVLAVGQAVAIAARNVPWNAVCLPQAMAAKAMLARRGQGSALHLGAARAGDGLTAHAWLVAGGEVVVGEAGIAEVAPLARFG
ncbi:MAG TPA: lasso peptide biosynthesis B2 protein [Reyranella sp.]|nr:lasso peptide biosynthesis B2 protein [Reyranella sp.]